MQPGGTVLSVIQGELSMVYGSTIGQIYKSTPLTTQSTTLKLVLTIV